MTMADQWEEFAAEALPSAMNPLLRSMMRQVYYSGGLAMLELLALGADLQGLREEFASFARENMAEVMGEFLRNHSPPPENGGR